MILKLVPIWSNDHPTVRVADSGRPALIGRNPECKILDRKCSRSQLVINFDRDLQKFMVEQRGIHGSKLNGQLIGRGKRRAVQPGDMVQVLVKSDSAGEYVYDVALDDSEFTSTASRTAASSSSSDHISEDTLNGSENMEEGDDDDTDVAARLKALKSQADAYFGDRMDTGDESGEVAGAASASVPTRPHRSKNTTRNLSGISESKPNLASSVPQNHFVGWRHVGDLFMWHSEGIQHSSKIAAFDLDWTIIGTKAGNTFPKTWDDWRILYPEIPKRLRELHKSGHKVVLFTNQKRHGQFDNVGLFRQKLEAIAAVLPTPVQIYGSAGGSYRKPLPGMWNYMRDYCNGGLELNRDECFYVGDAAGREASSTRKKKDFSCSDRLFAINIGIKFLTPEQFFLNKPAVEPFHLPAFDPIGVLRNPPKHLLDPEDAKLRYDNGPEIIVLVGYPATGKSTFATTHLKPLGFEIVNLDTMRTKTAKACLTAAEAALKGGRPVVIDNTNYDVATRAPYIALAATHRVPCRCFQMPQNIALALHLNRYRTMTGPDRAHRNVTDATLAMLKNKFVEPTVGEGFLELVKVNFVPHFSDGGDSELFGMYYG